NILIYTQQRATKMVSGVLTKIFTALESPFKGLDSGFEPKFFTMFEHFISFYISVSFGQPTFSQYVFQFLRMNWPSKYRSHIFNELGVETLKYLKQEGDPSKEFLEPYEKNLGTLGYFISVLANADISIYKKTNPWLYKYLVYHVGKFIGDKNGTKFEQTIISDDVKARLQKDEIAEIYKIH